MRKSGLNKQDITLLKKHLEADTPMKTIQKALKQVKPEVVKQYADSLTKGEEPEKKTVAKKPAAKKANDLI